MGRAMLARIFGETAPRKRLIARRESSGSDRPGAAQYSSAAPMPPVEISRQAPKRWYGRISGEYAFYM